jgi:mRNA-degrading endonuclease RelE of RelBE toxin-antitoxin system
VIPVELSEQVADFVMRQAPDSRKKLRRALRGLASEKGDLRALEGRLEGYHRLRVGAFRVVLRYCLDGGRRKIRCEFAERRPLVYEAFESLARSLR